MSKFTKAEKVIIMNKIFNLVNNNCIDAVMK